MPKASGISWLEWRPELESIVQLYKQQVEHSLGLDSLSPRPQGPAIYMETLPKAEWINHLIRFLESQQ